MILGDFNTGPEVLPYIVAEIGENYPLMVQQGWYNQNIESGEPFCTYCPDENNLIISTNPDDRAIDHVLVRNAGVQDTRRIFDEILNIGPPGGLAILVS